MERIPAKLISNIDATTIRFQAEIINRLRLFDFSKSAIVYYSKSEEEKFQGYSFDNLQSRFKLIGFKEGSKVKNIEYKDMVNIGNSFIKGELSDSIFVLNMATFEHWLIWVLKALILSNPREFYPKSSKKQIEVSYLKKFLDMPMLWEELADDYLITLPYQGMKSMLTTFLSFFGLKENDFTKNLLGLISENSQCRNVIMHNQKKVNGTYIKKCGKFGKYVEGESIIVTEDILFDQADNLLRFMQDFRNNHAKNRKTA
jgi:hypothetical protein